MTPGEVRTFDIRGVASDQGNFLPAGTVAISATLFVVGSTNPSGHWAAYPADLASVPNIASIYSDHSGAIIASSIIVPLGTTGANAGKIKVFSGPGGDIVLDINGVFLRDLNAGDQLAIQSTNAGQAAILGQNNSTAAGSHGIGGFANGAGPVHGVQGQVGSSAGAGSSGVHGLNGSTAANSWGVLGETTATAPGGFSAAVRGKNAGTGTSGIGVWGEQAGSGWGVFGEVPGAGIGVFGIVLSGAGIGVQGQAPAGSSGVHAIGNVSATGAKTFVDPHPTDPTKQIAYAALEGPEVGTYFRGRGRFEHGLATVIVPDSFRMSTEAEGLSVQVTPIGRLANVAVQSFDLNQIVLLGSEDVEFFVTVNGVRKGYADFSVIQDNTFFRPRGPEDNLWVSMTAEQRQRLVATGIYNADGTLNLATAQRLGWANGWTTTTTTTA